MKTNTFADLQSARALVCHKQHLADCGAGTVWFVLLADGYLIDCGAEVYSEARANTLADVINAADPASLAKDALKNWRA